MDHIYINNLFPVLLCEVINSDDEKKKEAYVKIHCKILFQTCSNYESYSQTSYLVKTNASIYYWCGEHLYNYLELLVAV